MARAANEHDTGIDPAMVVDLARQAIALTGNASFCAQTGIRLPPFRPLPSTEVVYENPETSCCPPSQIGHSIDPQFRRPSFYECHGSGPTAYLLENLGFVINLEKSVFVPTQQLEFLGFVINTIDMTLLLPRDKVTAIKALWKRLLEQQQVSVGELSQLIGKLTASIQAVFPAPLHYRNLQYLKHQGLARGGGYDLYVPLTTEVREEIQWWFDHLDA